ncbi:MAG: transketolase C-terminal domain-containing protein [Patescibacteria group bacterium]
MGEGKNEKLMEYYRVLARTRALNTVLIMRRDQIRPSPLLSGLGQEGVAVGVSLALRERGILLSSARGGHYRDMFGLGVVTDSVIEDHSHVFEILRNHFMRATSFGRGRDANIHWGCLPCRIIPYLCSDTGRMTNPIVGFAEEARRLEWPRVSECERPVGIVMLGEGAMQQGGVYEAMNWIAASNVRRSSEAIAENERFLDAAGRALGTLRGAPVIMVVTVNNWSIYTDNADEFGNAALEDRAFGFGSMRGIRIDGDNLMDVIETTRWAIERAQRLQATLIVADSPRKTAHNEDQIQRDKDWVAKGDVRQGAIRGVSPEDFERAWQSDPVKRFRDYLTSGSHVTEAILLAIDEEEMRFVQGLADGALLEPGPDLKGYREDSCLFPPHKKSMPAVVQSGSSSGKTMLYNEALLWVLNELMECDERVTYFGQDAATGGVLVQTRRLAEKFGPRRVFNAPISEEAIIGNAAGRALYGSKPFCEFQFAPFWWDGAPIFAAVLAPGWYQKRIAFPLVALFHCGVVHGGGSGHYHEDWPDAPLLSMGGIAIAAPANAYDLVGLMRAAHEYSGPIAFFLQIHAYGNSEFSSVIPSEPYAIPLGLADVKRAGTDATIVTYGACSVAAALNEARFLADEGVSVEVIDLRTPAPLDVETIVRSVHKTGRLVLMHEARKVGGVGEHIIATLMARGAMPSLRTECVRILAPETPGPSHPALVWDRLPYELCEEPAEDEQGHKYTRRFVRSRKLADAVRECMRY